MKLKQITEALGHEDEFSGDMVAVRIFGYLFANDDFEQHKQLLADRLLEQTGLPWVIEFFDVKRTENIDNDKVMRQLRMYARKHLSFWYYFKADTELYPNDFDYDVVSGLKRALWYKTIVLPNAIAVLTVVVS